MDEVLYDCDLGNPLSCLLGVLIALEWGWSRPNFQMSILVHVHASRRMHIICVRLLLGAFKDAVNDGGGHGNKKKLVVS